MLTNEKTREQNQSNARKLVKRWFADENTTESELHIAIARLQAGFKKMLAVLNANQLVLTDHPQIRNAIPLTKDHKNLKSEAFVKEVRENLDVIYIQNSFFTNQIVMRGNRDFARILIHELSHREAGNIDYFYAHEGIKPTKNRLPFAHTMKNADSWAFFAVDAAGQLSKNELDFALRN